MPTSREEFNKLGVYTPKKRGSSLEKKTEQLFRALGYKVERNAKKCGQSGTFHEIDVLAIYDTPLYKSIVLIECKEHENTIGKEIVMKLDGVIRDVGADKGIIISSGGFARGALSYAKNLNIELWGRERFNKEIGKIVNEGEDADLIEEGNETKLEIVDNGFIGEIQKTFRIFFKVQNNSLHTIRNLHAELNLKDKNGNLLDSKKQRLGTIRSETVETYTTRFQTYCGELKVEIIICDDEIEYVRRILNYKINEPGGCFIATAAYGTPFAGEIDILRNWRDQKLNKNIIGKIFVRIYYTISPPLAKIISKSDTLRLIVRWFLVPLIKKLKTIQT